MQKRTIASYFQPLSNKKQKSEQAEAAPADKETQGQGEPTPASAAPLQVADTAESFNQAGPSEPKQPAGAVAQGPAQGKQQQRQQLPLAADALAELAARNHAAAGQAVAAAIRKGRAPALKDLLVEGSWLEALQPQFKMAYWSSLEMFVAKEWSTPGNAIYPAKDSIFRAYNSCPLASVRVVILGQDPYHNPGQAMGMSFSVPRGTAVPSSLGNMYKELGTDCGCTRPRHGDLQQWADQGVFLLNATLTVRAKTPGSHQKKGWESFTDATIRTLSQQRKGLVFLLWGNWAKAKGALIDKGRHHVLEAAHPSGLSASRGFFGCRHFSKANTLLQASGMPPIDWQIGE